MKIAFGFVLGILVLSVTSAQAEMIITNVSPSTETAWTSASNGNATIGSGGAGILTVNDNDGPIHIYSKDTYIGSGSTNGTATISGSETVWTCTTTASLFRVGSYGPGSLYVLDGATLTSTRVQVGVGGGSSGYVKIADSGKVNVDGHFYVGSTKNGELDILSGGMLTCTGLGIIGNEDGSTGLATVSDAGSTWFCSALKVGGYDGGGSGAGVLTIKDSGLVAASSTIDIGIDGGSDSYIHMSTGGMLALAGDYDDNLSMFMNQIGGMAGTDGIYYLDASENWSPLTSGTMNVDYTLAVQSYEDADYTVLTVGPVAVPEPGSIALLLTALLAIGCVRKRKQ